MGIEELFNRPRSHDQPSIWECVFQGVRDRIAALCAYPLPDVSFAPDPLIRAEPPETAKEHDAHSNSFDPPVPISDDEVEVGFSLWRVHYPWTVMNAADDDLDRRFSIRFKEDLFRQIAKGNDEAVARMARIIEQRCLFEMAEGFVRHHLTGIANDFHRDAAIFCDNGNGVPPILSEAQMTSMARGWPSQEPFFPTGRMRCAGRLRVVCIRGFAAPDLPLLR